MFPPGLYKVYLAALLSLLPYVLRAASGQSSSIHHLSPSTPQRDLSLAPPVLPRTTRRQQTPSRFPPPIDSRCDFDGLKPLPLTACLSAIESLYYWSGPDHPLIYYGNNPRRAKPGVYMAQESYTPPQFKAYDMDRRICEVAITNPAWPSYHLGPHLGDDRFVIMDLEYMAVQVHRILLRCEKGGHAITLPNLDPRLHGHREPIQVAIFSDPS